MFYLSLNSSVTEAVDSVCIILKATVTEASDSVLPQSIGCCD